MEVKTKAQSNPDFFLFSFLPLLLSAAQRAQQPMTLENCLWQGLESIALLYWNPVLFWMHTNWPAGKIQHISGTSHENSGKKP